MGGSQLKQLKAAISSSGVNQSPSNPRKRKRGTSFDSGAVLEHREKRAEKLKAIHEKFNPFDIKVEKLKHDVGGRKIKGVVGKPSLSKQAGLDQRKKTLLVEYEKKDKVGGVMDRRFGENDPTMSLEERMLGRFTKERQRASKGTIYNLEDQEELTHYGQSLSKLDDFDNIGLNLDDEDAEDDAGQIDANTVKATHFKGFSDDESMDDEDGPPRKKTKAEVMAEVMAKSKEHKYARQLQREQDENMRHTLDEDFDSIRGILFSGQADKDEANEPPLPSQNESSTKPPIPVESVSKDKDYDLFVRELAMDKRAQPKDRTKTEEEIALEEKEALELAEKKRLRRMMGEKEESDDETRQVKKRTRGGDDLDDDFILDDDDMLGQLGTGLDNAEGERKEEESTESGSNDSGSETGTESREDSDVAESDEEDNYGPSDEGEEAEEGDQEELLSTRIPSDKKAKANSRKSGTDELPFTFPCPATHEEFLEVVEDVPSSQVGTVVERIRKLHHPSLHADNKFKLQSFIGVLVDHVLYAAGQMPPSLESVDGITPHLFALSKAYPISSAEKFVAKLNLMQKNLARGLQDPVDSSSKTFPGHAELALLRILGSIWSTSDMKHVVVGPARYLMGAYLGLGRVRDLKDVASGLYLCTLFLQYEALSKRLVPEVINFVVQTLLLISPNSFNDMSSVPGSFPVPDIKTVGSSFKFRSKYARDVNQRKPPLFNILSGDDKGEQAKLDLLTLALELTARCGEMYKGLDGFIELFDPILSILSGLSTKKLPHFTSQKIVTLVDRFERMVKFARQARRPLLLQDHKPIPIATYIPKFDMNYSSYMRSRDPDEDRAALSKLKAQVKKEKKGAMRELRKDNRFLASLQQERQEAKDREYKARMAKAFSSLEGERAEQRKEEKDKKREKRRAGRKK
ncbi:Nop14-like protein [Serendipita vermifera]|nr:Nop14-like protein [Serendipita vermifera]